MTDLTSAFLAAVAKASCDAADTDHSDAQHAALQARLFRSKRRPKVASTEQVVEAHRQALDVMENLSATLRLLQHHSDDYTSCIALADRMSDRERRALDDQIDSISTSTKQFLQLLQSQIVDLHEGHVGEHFSGLAQVIDSVLARLVEKTRQMRQIRADNERQKISLERLGSLHQRVEPTPAPRRMPTDSVVEASAAAASTMRNGDNETSSIADCEDTYVESNLFSPDELQQLQAENEQLYDEIDSMRSDVRRVAGEVHRVATLHEMFSDKVFEQENLVEEIVDEVEKSDMNVTDANAMLVDALRKSTGFRYWITFILVVLSFTLLFLDWYNY